MTKSIYFCFAALSVFIGGCASKSSEIEASYVSPVTYQNFSCQQLNNEAMIVSQKASKAAGMQDKAHREDTTKTAIGAVIFWPVLLFNKGDGQLASNLANLKGQKDAIELASTQKGCGVNFQAQ